MRLADDSLDYSVVIVLLALEKWTYRGQLRIAERQAILI